VAGDPLGDVGRPLDVVPGQGPHIDVKAHAASLVTRRRVPVAPLCCLKQLDPASPVLP